MVLLKKSFVYGVFRDVPTLTTERLTLRRLKTSDSHDMYEYSCDPQVTKYLLWEPHKSHEQTKNYLHYVQKCYRDGRFHDWAVISNYDKKMIGTCGFTTLDFENNCAEIGYVLNPKYWGQGIAAEAVRRVMDFGFMEMNVHRIEAKYIIGNDASRRVMEKCGMTFEGVKRSSMFIKGDYRDIGIYSILYDEYMRSR